MIFNSIPFIVFALLFFAAWPWVQKNNNAKWLWICTMSFVFYAWWDWRFMFLLLGTGSVDYMCGQQIYRSEKRKKFWLTVSMVTNIASLCFFKYSVWLVHEFNDWMNDIGFTTCFADTIPEYSLVLPIGISFYTFNSMSYAIDLYRGKAEPAKNVLHFMAFISFFPHLVAGPIIRAKEVLVQLNKSHQLNKLQIVNACKTILWGFFLKMVLADNIAIMVNAQFDVIHTSTDSLTWWYCMIGFAFQIYFDFNGYSSIARGLAKLCGIHFRLNFNHPYLSGSFSEFWRRWHISLSSFFKDYVYISLGGNRKGKWRSEWNRWITMLLSGLWHGANFTFIIWGALHAFFLSIENLYRRYFASRIPALTFKKYPIIVFIGVLVAWVFFRASNLDDALFVVRNMFAFNHKAKWMELISNSASVWILIGVFVELYPLYKNFINPLKHWIIQGLFWALVACMLVFFRGEEQGFIYFQF